MHFLFSELKMGEQSFSKNRKKTFQSNQDKKTRGRVKIEIKV